MKQKNAPTVIARLIIHSGQPSAGVCCFSIICVSIMSKLSTNKRANILSVISVTNADTILAAFLGISLGEYTDILSQSQGFAVLSYEKLIQDNVFAANEPRSTTELPEQQMGKEELKEIIAEPC